MSPQAGWAYVNIEEPQSDTLYYIFDRVSDTILVSSYDDSRRDERILFGEISCLL